LLRSTLWSRRIIMEWSRRIIMEWSLSKLGGPTAGGNVSLNSDELGMLVA